MVAWLRAGLAVLVLHLLLVQPAHPSGFDFRALWRVPLELPAILLALVASVNSAVGRMVRAGTVLAITGIFILRTADAAAYAALGRSFNPVADLTLVDAGVRLIAGSFGMVAALGAVVCALLIIVGVAAAVWWATGVWSRLRLPAPTRWAAAAGCVSAIVVSSADAGLLSPRWNGRQVPGDAFALRFAAAKAEQAQETAMGLRDFAKAAREDTFASVPRLLDAIDRDFLLIFVESYGRASLDVPFYAERHKATLEAADARLSGLGLAMRSAFLEAPTTGGQSWLSHATFANGLWIDDQALYLAALSSGRDTLFHIAERNGFHTAVVAPAITMAWPEAEQMGFETILAAKDLGYRGKPFNWVTMPDQFTLAAADRLLMSGNSDSRPIFAEVSLISSHAPWVPVPELVAWEELGDGRVFDAVATSGDPPDVVWRDKERVRIQYRKALDYALNAVFDYAARRADDPPLMVILGDHQTAGWIGMDERPHVPVHLVGPPALVDRAEDWGWNAGLVPAPTPVIPMARMRDMILRAYSTAPEVRAGG
ncbi:sulfatase-like hydrolase/transferase [Tropicimonas isoalkanivorans]|uniref:Sulfatase N-terminal domain-containing protein n=1 Tax=Tropicimonas isoalkanivorans TaxID=441112 RepID=A0A1I1LV24_9RHOB|nr:sulfatase-like hydrolase/transferase [Tropicimonas isoalkanivorans]SFC73320.1 hypothetical protein SAMN04488094_108161 [Tropicimonas isoalkanivorans]